MERMGKNKALLWRLCVPVVFWAIIALVILLLPPVPQEPENLLPETWSYYGNDAPIARQVLKYRNEILFSVLVCAVVTELLLFVFEKRKKQTR